ncbi:MAG TPA: PQQ-binding-like beta-propeller repeat protein [Pirellulales bacterium]|jgi:outer membrane protein assembly factor BamB|nr:PQQ-binding-like beta-propeller repeat protein [Pirellulales bacterium]
MEASGLEFLKSVAVCMQHLFLICVHSRSFAANLLLNAFRIHSRSFAANLLLGALLICGGCEGNHPAAPAAGNHPAAAVAGDDSDSSTGGPWPVFRQNAQATGVAESTLPQELQLLWKYTVQKGSFESTPVIVDGAVYIGDMDGTFYALDLRSGQERWKFDLGKDKAGFTAAAAVRDGRVYIGDMDGNFLCLDAQTHEKKWTATAGAEIDSAANFYHDVVLFGSQDTTLYCCNAASGKQQWTHQIGDQIRCSPTVVEDCCFLAGCDGKLHVIDLHDGQETGAVEIAAPTGSTPAASGELIYFGTEGGTFLCVNWKRLEKVWDWQDRLRGQSIRSSAALTDKAVIFGGRDKMVHALDPKTGDKRWDFITKGRVDSSPVVVGQRVFFGSADGRIYALDMATGEKVWDYECGGRLVGSPAVAQGRLVIASDAGVIYCWGEKK